MPKKRSYNPYRIKLADGSAIERDYRTNEAGQQTPSGNWKWVVYDPTRHPRTKKINLRTKDQGGALQKANGLVMQRATGALDPWTDQAPREGVTLAAAAEDYLAAKLRDGKSPATVETDRGHLSRFERSLAPGFLVRHIEQHHIKAFLNRPTRAGKQPSGAYRHRVRATLQHFFGWAAERGMLRDNPTTNVRPPKAAPARREHVTEAELRAIIEAIEASERETGQDRSWLKDWVVFGFGTGLRPGEQRQLLWNAVSLSERTIHVGKGHRTKTAKSARVVPVRGDALEILQRRSASHSRHADGHVFTGAGGGPVATAYVTKQIQKLALAAGIEKNVVDYSLRHGYGTALAQAGVPLWDIANLMGTSIRMVEKHYGHYEPRRGAAYIEAVFGSAPARAVPANKSEYAGS